jgi:ABC-type transport system involved in cytochrome c biogenesis permease component
MVDERILLSMLWVALMLTYLLGDVLRIFSGDFTPGEMEGMQATQGMWLGIAVLLTMPIAMVVLSLTLPHNVNRWTNLGVAVLLVVFNLVGLPTYSSAYDRFLIVVGLVIGAVIVWYAWNWDPATAQYVGG